MYCFTNEITWNYTNCFVLFWNGLIIKGNYDSKQKLHASVYSFTQFSFNRSVNLVLLYVSKIKQNLTSINVT